MGSEATVTRVWKRRKCNTQKISSHTKTLRSLRINFLLHKSCRIQDLSVLKLPRSIPRPTFLLLLLSSNHNFHSDTNLPSSSQHIRPSVSKGDLCSWSPDWGLNSLSLKRTRPNHLSDELLERGFQGVCIDCILN